MALPKYGTTAIGAAMALLAAFSPAAAADKPSTNPQLAATSTEQQRTAIYSAEQAKAKSLENGGQIVFHFGEGVTLADNLARALASRNIRAQALAGFEANGMIRVYINGNEINKSFPESDIAILDKLAIKGYQRWVTASADQEEGAHWHFILA
jgi:hypothetical protein